MNLQIQEFILINQLLYQNIEYWTIIEVLKYIFVLKYTNLLYKELDTESFPSIKHGLLERPT